jgi:predicted nucleic-acid-binding protein
MIGVDTNVLLRALTGDDAVRSPAAARLIESFTPQMPGYLNLVVIVEAVWTFKRKYRASREDVLTVVETLLESASWVLADRDAVTSALEIARGSDLDFPDALIAALNLRAGCMTTLTFDAKAAQHPLFSPQSV